MDFGVVLQTQPARLRASSSSPSRPSARLHATSGRSTRTCSGRSRTSSTARSSPQTATVIVGPMVTNPATRDWTVTASLFATLNEMYGNRTVCGIGRGDSAVRVTNGKPVDARRRCASRSTSSASSPTAAPVEYKGATLRFPWSHGLDARRLGRRVRPEGAQARPARSATASSCSSPTSTSPRGRSRRCARPRRAAGRDPDVDHDLRRGPDVRRRRPGRTCATSAAGSAAWSATTSPTSSRKYGADGATCPQALTDYIAGRAGLRLQRARPGRQHPRRLRARRDRRPVLPPRHRPRSTSPSSRSCKALGVDQFAVYLQHDNKEETLRVYGETVIPALASTSRPRHDDRRDRRSQPRRAPRRVPSRRASGCRAWARSRAGVLGVVAARRALGALQVARPGRRRRASARPRRAAAHRPTCAMPHVWDMVARLLRARHRAPTARRRCGRRCRRPRSSPSASPRSAGWSASSSASVLGAA